MSLPITKYAEYHSKEQALERMRGWLDHIGKEGRSTRAHTDTLRISPAHCKAPAFSVAGQYTTGGQNYWTAHPNLTRRSWR